MTLIGPCSTSSSSPVSSVTSRRAASAGGSPDSRCPLGKPQFLYESRISRKRVTPPSRRNTTPPALVSRCARPCFLRGIPLEHAEREVLARIRLNVGQELPQLDHREGRLPIQRRIADHEAQRAAAVCDPRQDRIGGHQGADQAL